MTTDPAASPVLLPARTPAELEQIELDGMTDDQLLDELGKAFGQIDQWLVRAARIVIVFEKRGRDMSDVKAAFGVNVARLACGSIAPEVVVKFAKMKALTQAVITLPFDEQREIANGKRLLVVEKTADGFTHRMLPARCLNADQTKQVFDADRGTVRSEVEQINFLNPPRKPAAVNGKSRVRLRNGRLYVPEEGASVEDVMDVLRRAKLI